MIYWSPDSLKPFRIWAPAVFILAENTARSISLAFDRYLPGNFSITRSLSCLLPSLLFAEIPLGLLWPFFTSHCFLPSPPAVLPCLHQGVPGCGASRTAPFWFLKAGQSGWEWCCGEPRAATVTLRVKCCFHRGVGRGQWWQWELCHWEGICDTRLCLGSTLCFSTHPLKHIKKMLLSLWVDGNLKPF